MSLETDPVQPVQSAESNELTYLLLQEEKSSEKQFEELSSIDVPGRHAGDEFKDTENMHELSTIMKEVYTLTQDKFEHELLQLIEPGHTLENWQHHGYSHAEAETFSSVTNLDEDSMTHEDMQSSSCDTSVTLTVINSTSTEDASQAVPFLMTRPVTHHSLIDHNYYAYSSPKQELQEYSDLSVDSPGEMSQESDIGMDQEKLQRMQRRKEKNRECSRQFRLKQKNKEQMLTLGKIEKSKTLENTKRNVEKFKAILSKVSQKCSDCPKTSMLLSQFITGSDKENINPNIAQNYFK